MSTPTKKAATSVEATAQQQDFQLEPYHKFLSNSRGNFERRQAKIAERRAQIPRSYRATYDRAVKGRSLRAAINAQCLECVCWQRKEITLCTDLACPLYAVRPYQSPQNGRQGQVSGVESKNSE